MSLRTILLLGVAVGAAGVTGVLANAWLDAQREALAARPTAEAAAPDPMATVEILVAADVLPPGTFVRPSLLRWQEWPEAAVADGHVVRDAGSEEDFAGAVVRTHLMAGEPITPSRVVHPGDQGFLAAVLAPGKRAISVPVDAATGIAGFVFPGDRVDVILTFDMTFKGESDQQGNTRYFSETLVSGVRVLAVDQSLDNVDGSAKLAKTVTLEVDRKQAEKLALGLDLGSLSLALRSLVGGAPEGAADRGDHATALDEDEGLPSYTRDIDALFVLRDTRIGSDSKKTGTSVQILHGIQAEEVVF